MNNPQISDDYNLKDYSISFWIKLDRDNEFCETEAKRKYYFLAYPHVLYNDFSSKEEKTNLGYKIYYDSFANTNNKILISNFSQYNWNHVYLEFNSKTKIFKIIVNNNYFNPQVLIENISNTSLYMFSNLIFCPNDIYCNINNIKSEKFIWGSAFYRDLIINDSIDNNFIVHQEKYHYG